MNKTLKTSVVAIALAGGGAIGVGTLASASYGGDDPTTEAPDTADDASTADDTDGTDEVAPQGLQVTPDDETGDVPDGEGEAGGRRGRHGAKHSEAIAEALGITPEQLQEARQAGQSVADMAAAQGVDIAVVEAAILSDIQEHLAEEVAEGELTQEQADEKLAGAAERVNESVNRVPTDGGERGPRGARGFRNSETVTDTLGLTADELQEAREAGQSLADVATAQGVDVDTLVQAIVDDVEEHLAEHVADGDLTQEEADAKLAGAAERVNESVNRVPTDGGERGPRGARGFRNSETVTDTLGLTADELQEAREAGQSLADVATAQGVDVDTLVQAIVDDVEEHLAEHVADGDLTQEEADAKLAGAAERVTERVNTAPGEGDGERGPRGQRGPRGGDAPADDAGTDG